MFSVTGAILISIGRMGGVLIPANAALLAQRDVEEHFGPVIVALIVTETGVTTCTTIETLGG